MLSGIARLGANGTVHYYYADHLGSTRRMSTAGGALCFDADYYPGVYPERSRRGGERVYLDTCGSQYKFTGQERDSESGLDFFGARYYSSAQGRYLSADGSATPVPVPYADFSNPQSLNLYSYVGNNPLN